jgi:hypothetical protein
MHQPERAQLENLFAEDESQIANRSSAFRAGIGNSLYHHTQ